MKSKIILSSLFLIGLFLFSCNSTSNEPISNNSSKNYWDRNDLSFMQIKGNAKTITEIDSTNEGAKTIVTQFNKDGFITSSSYTYSYGYKYIVTFSYNSNNQVTKWVKKGISLLIYTDSATMEYGSHGKYVPSSLGMSGMDLFLSYNLTASVIRGTRKDYVFKGDHLLIITTPVDFPKERDTTLVEFSGKYPVSITINKYSTDNWFVPTKDITYASNGMFKSYTNTVDNLGTYTFKTDDDYLLLESISNSELTSYTYNTQKDLINISSNNDKIINYSYVYDSKLNWTKRTESIRELSYMFSYLWSATRTIDYWN